MAAALAAASLSSAGRVRFNCRAHQRAVLRDTGQGTVIVRQRGAIERGSMGGRSGREEHLSHGRVVTAAQSAWSQRLASVPPPRMSAPVATRRSSCARWSGHWRDQSCGDEGTAHGAASGTPRSRTAHAIPHINGSPSPSVQALRSATPQASRSLSHRTAGSPPRLQPLFATSWRCPGSFLLAITLGRSSIWNGSAQQCAAAQ